MKRRELATQEVSVAVQLLGEGAVNRPLCSSVAAVDCVTRERKVRLLLEYQFDFIIFLFVSIVCPALSHHACPASGSSR